VISSDLKKLAISDTLFKKVFTNKQLLCDYVNAICDSSLEVKNVNYHPIEIKSKELERGIRLDVRVREIDGKKHTEVDLEAQTTMPNYNTFINRKLYYASSLFKDGFQEGDDYSKEVYSKTIFFILEDKHLIGSPIKKTIAYETYDKKEYNQIEIYEIYIRNLLATNLEEFNEYVKMVAEICSVLVDTDFEKYSKSTNEIVQKVAIMMKEMTLDEAKKIREEWDRQFEAEMKELDDICRQEGFEQGMAKGLEQGKQEIRSKIVRNMKEQGFSVEVIAECVGLSPEEVKEIIK